MDLIRKTETTKNSNGFIKVPSKVIEKLIAYRIPGEQMQCLLFIMRKTYGWNKKEDIISLSQFVEATGINKRNVSRALRELINKKIVIKKDNNTGASYSFNEVFKKWKALSKKIMNKINNMPGRISITEMKAKIRKRDNNRCMLCNFDGALSNHLLPVHHIDFNQTNNNDNNLITLCTACHCKSHTIAQKTILQKTMLALSKKIIGGVSKKTTTIDTITIDTITKDRSNSDELQPPLDKNVTFPLNNGRSYKIAKFLFKLIQKRDSKIKEPNWKEWSTHIDRLNRIDKRDFTEIKKVIRWCQQDDFWQNNILSTSKLRKQYSQLRLKMLQKPKYKSNLKTKIGKNKLSPEIYEEENPLTINV